MQVGVPTSIRPGDEWLYNTTANGLFVPFMTKTAYAEMIAAGNIANGSTSSGWTFGATFGEYVSVGAYVYNAPIEFVANQANAIGTNYNNLHGNGRNQVTSIIMGVAGWATTLEYRLGESDAGIQLCSDEDGPRVPEGVLTVTKTARAGEYLVTMKDGSTKTMRLSGDLLDAYLEMATKNAPGRGVPPEARPESRR